MKNTAAVFVFANERYSYQSENNSAKDFGKFNYEQIDNPLLQKNGFLR